MTEEERRDDAAREFFERAGLDALARRVEDGFQRVDHELGRARQQVRDLKAELDALDAYVRARPGRHFDVMDAAVAESAWRSSLRRLRQRVGLRTRLRAAARWCARVWRAMVGSDPNDDKGGTP